jgi:hypothetical protein
MAVTQAGFGLAPEELEAHKQHLSGVSDTLADASTGAAGMGSPPMAFGLIGSFIPAMLQPMIAEAAGVISAAAESVGETSRMVGSAAQTYGEMESSGAEGFAALEGEL